MLPVRQLRDEMDRLLTGFFSETPDGIFPGALRGQPAVNVWDTGETIVVEAETPGLKSDQLDITVTGGELTLKLERPELTRKGERYHRRERPVGSFTRVVQLPAEVDAQGVRAELHDGVLSISLPKAASAKPRKIEVAAAK
jgi:HSP20 family protein